jgi:hypothetical protein
LREIVIHFESDAKLHSKYLPLLLHEDGYKAAEYKVLAP